MKFENVLVMGTGRLAFQCILCLEQFFDKADIDVIETQISGISVLKSLCEEHRISYAHLPRSRIEERLKKITEKTLVVSAVNIYIFQPWFIQREHIKIVNYHNALLPRHRGRNAEAWAIFDGDAETGVTWHFVDVGVDTGRIIEQKSVAIETGMTSIQLLRRQNELAGTLFNQFIEPLLNGKLAGTEQSCCGEEQLHFQRDAPNDGFLDIRWGMDQMFRFLCAMDYGAVMALGRPVVMLHDKRFQIVKYNLTTEQGRSESGRTMERIGGQLIFHENGRKLCLWLQPADRKTIRERKQESV